jgi:hypothetical protein
MPRGADGQHALTIMEWAYESKEAAVASPDLVGVYRKAFDAASLTDESFRGAFDLALVIWEEGYRARQERIRRAMELF